MFEYKQYREGLHQKNLRFTKSIRLTDIQALPNHQFQHDLLTET